jgi:hypothetical protein
MTKQKLKTVAPVAQAKTDNLDALEQARQKKLDFFRALGQATLEEMETAPKNDVKTTSNNDARPTLISEARPTPNNDVKSFQNLPTYILNASDYNRQISAPNATFPVSTLTPCSRQKSVPASWREEVRKKSHSTDRGLRFKL